MIPNCYGLVNGTRKASDLRAIRRARAGLGPRAPSGTAGVCGAGREVGGATNRDQRVVGRQRVAAPQAPAARWGRAGSKWQNEGALPTRRGAPCPIVADASDR